MRPSMIVGILLAVLGAVIVFRGLTVTQREEVVDVGPLRVEAQQRERVPAWIGGVAIVGGLALVLAGGKRARA